MALEGKLDLLNLSEKERKKAEGKFLATLALSNTEEIKDIIAYLKAQGVELTKAREIKVLGNSKDEIAKKFNILNEINETEIYIQDPTAINKNVIDIYKRLNYCKQSGVPYKDEDGIYKACLFSEEEFKKEFSKDEIRDVEVTVSEPQIQVQVPEESSPVIDFTEDFTYDSVEEPEKIYETENIDLSAFMDINSDINDLEQHTTSFANLKEELNDESIKDELESQLAQLESLRTQSFDEINFNDIQPESFGMGR